MNQKTSKVEKEFYLRCSYLTLSVLFDKEPKVPCLTAWLYPNEMEESGFEPLNPKERIYSPSRLATSLLLRKVCINLT